MTTTPDDTGSPGDDAAPDSPSSTSSPAGAVVREIPIINKRGLHARASAKFVQMVERFNAEISVTRNGETVGGTSIMGLMMLSAGPGTSIVVSATGPEAEAAIAALTELIGSKFGEE
jgi:phosphocarrier protein HPr